MEEEGCGGCGSGRGREGLKPVCWLSDIVGMNEAGGVLLLETECDGRSAGLGCRG